MQIHVLSQILDQPFVHVLCTMMPPRDCVLMYMNM